ncbi:MAG: PTS sugar transporter subunit IIA [Treponema sp.]|jgi:PTS system nitrogen regulatory IIA component|nr:PTS sugar transporter subunit IIA [Treponema sp.]
MVNQGDDVPLSLLVERGGVFYGLLGASVEALVTELTGLIPCLDGGDPANKALLQAVLEREALMSTGIGRGVALPHPRNPLIADTEKQLVSIGFPAVPVDWKALDGKPVHTALLIVSASAKLHLHTFSKINFLCQDNDFLSLLRNRAPQDRIIGAIREAERGWGGMPGIREGSPVLPIIKT